MRVVLWAEREVFGPRYGSRHYNAAPHAALAPSSHHDSVDSAALRSFALGREASVVAPPSQRHSQTSHHGTGRIFCC